jgi:hypothetical protein
VSTVLDEPLSPELVLVSPPELAKLAREALPDYEREYDEWVVRTRAAFEAAHAREHEAERRTQLGSIAFTCAVLLNGLAALALPILLR